eukprot:GHVR01067631.1.p1 GENE.GHVR01067631.1~~GHVR01067631.1.p1  ORF type:complete len:218 (-),score=76.31 GHVR01067631.1:514-1083(-)
MCDGYTDTDDKVRGACVERETQDTLVLRERWIEELECRVTSTVRRFEELEVLRILGVTGKYQVATISEIFNCNGILPSMKIKWISLAYANIVQNIKITIDSRNSLTFGALMHLQGAHQVGAGQLSCRWSHRHTQHTHISVGISRHITCFNDADVEVTSALSPLTTFSQKIGFNNRGANTTTTIHQSWFV